MRIPESDHLRLLIIDDVKIIHSILDRLVQRYCTDKEVEVSHAYTVDEALEYLREHVGRGDGWILLIDYLLPPKKGTDVVEFVRQLDPRLQDRMLLVGMTSPIDTSTIKTMNESFHKVLWKPIEKEWSAHVKSMIHACRAALKTRNTFVEQHAMMESSR